MNQIVFPSGENLKSSTDRSGVVNSVHLAPDARSYASRDQRSASKPARRCARTTIHRPSGEYTGVMSAAGFDVVSFFAAPPDTGTVQTSWFVVHISESLPSRFDTNASSRESGENAIAPSS